jgi:hypothetical protein
MPTPRATRSTCYSKDGLSEAYSTDELLQLLVQSIPTNQGTSLFAQDLRSLVSLRKKQKQENRLPPELCLPSGGGDFSGNILLHLVCVCCCAGGYDARLRQCFKQTFKQLGIPWSDFIGTEKRVLCHFLTTVTNQNPTSNGIVAATCASRGNTHFTYASICLPLVYMPLPSSNMVMETQDQAPISSAVLPSVCLFRELFESRYL